MFVVVVVTRLSETFQVYVCMQITIGSYRKGDEKSSFHGLGEATVFAVVFATWQSETFQVYVSCIYISQAIRKR